MNIYEIEYRVDNGILGQEVVATSIASAVKALLADISTISPSRIDSTKIFTEDCIRSISISYGCTIANPEE